jgi:hypothetical protein
VHSRDLVLEWAGVLRRARYSGCYSAGFGVALPVCLLASLFEHADNSVTQGVRDGAIDARTSIGHMLTLTQSEVI